MEPAANALDPGTVYSVDPERRQDSLAGRVLADGDRWRNGTLKDVEH